MLCCVLCDAVRVVCLMLCCVGLESIFGPFGGCLGGSWAALGVSEVGLRPPGPAKPRGNSGQFQKSSTRISNARSFSSITC